MSDEFDVIGSVLRDMNKTRASMTETEGQQSDTNASANNMQEAPTLSVSSGGATSGSSTSVETRFGKSKPDKPKKRKIAKNNAKTARKVPSDSSEPTSTAATHEAEEQAGPSGLSNAQSTNDHTGVQSHDGDQSQDTSPVENEEHSTVTVTQDMTIMLNAFQESMLRTANGMFSRLDEKFDSKFTSIQNSVTAFQASNEQFKVAMEQRFTQYRDGNTTPSEYDSQEEEEYEQAQESRDSPAQGLAAAAVVQAPPPTFVEQTMCTACSCCEGHDCPGTAACCAFNVQYTVCTGSHSYDH